MNHPEGTKAQRLARAAHAFEWSRMGIAPEAVTAVLGGETLVIAVRGALSPAERILCQTVEGRGCVGEFHRQLFTPGAEMLRQEIKHITGVEVCEATVEIEPATGTVVQVYLLARDLPPNTSLVGTDAIPAASRTETIVNGDHGARAGSGLRDEREPWQRLLADAGPRDHIVQLYQDQNFLNRAVCRFAASALANGEGVILVPTIAHWNAIRPRLEAEGVDVQAAQRNGQLTVVESEHLLPQFMQDEMPSAPIFLGLAADVIEQSRARDRFPQVRWWGEMVNVLWERGDVDASMALEDLFDQLAHQQGIAIFCSFLMDNFDGDVHARMLPRLGDNHSHLIPVEDYERLENAVGDALRDIVGADEARVFEERLLQGYPARFKMPRSQALLLALAQFLPIVGNAVRKGTRSRYVSSAESNA